VCSSHWFLPLKILYDGRLAPYFQHTHLGQLLSPKLNSSGEQIGAKEMGTCLIVPSERLPDLIVQGMEATASIGYNVCAEDKKVGCPSFLGDERAGFQGTLGVGCLHFSFLHSIVSTYDARFSVKRSHLAREIVETLVLTLLIFLVIHFAVQNYRVEGLSMQPGLYSDEYVLVNKLAYLFHAPERGDVVIFHYPLDTNRDFIKRVIGVPGDTVTTDSTNVWVNGVLLKEPYISEPFNSEAGTWKLKTDQYFVLGDNRPASDDSRVWGVVPKNYIIGKAVIVYWPLGKWQLINTYSSVFAQIKGSH
jgi:signal peptidase I